VRHLRRHARRLRRDARALGLAAPAARTLEEALLGIGGRQLGGDAGVVRVSLARDPERPGALTTSVSVRPLGFEPSALRVLAWTGVHPGAGGVPGVKREGVAAYEKARAAAQCAGADDALLFDAEGYLVEGARTNVFVVAADGALLTPPLRRGAVAGVAREIVFERVAQTREADLPRSLLASAREIVLVNAVRGAVRVAEIDGRACGHNDDGAPWTARLHALLLADPPPLRS